MPKKVATALISVTDKSGLKEFARFLQENDVKILSTGGTAKFLKEEGVRVTEISDYTGFPEIMDGRVKTLHPKVHGGILAQRDNPSHIKAMREHDIAAIDMVVVNLYPFNEVVKKGSKHELCLENIDIGGPSMLRSASKNYKDVVTLCDPDDYGQIMEEMKIYSGSTSEETRKNLAAKAFVITASYDAAISAWFNQEMFPSTLALTARQKCMVRYGENPHQPAAIYIQDFAYGVANAAQLQGKELSYNNVMDADAAFELVNEFTTPTVAIIKHANPCGVATASTLVEAYTKALASDPVSAYGSVIAFNQEIDAATAQEIGKLFVEVIIAPSMSEDARMMLTKKTNLRVLITGGMPGKGYNAVHVRSVMGGLLLQERDRLVISEEDLSVVTKRQPTREQIEEMLFAFRVCKYVKSNAIVLSKDKATISIGAGQMSRVDAVKIAGGKALDKKEKNLIMASDAFFPFADGIVLGFEAGVTAIIQPGGSIRDQEVIQAADERDIAMVFTKVRHFRH